MYLHFDNEVFVKDLKALLDGFIAVANAYDRHKGLAKKLRDPKCGDRKQAKITVVANCADCGVSLHRDVTTIWHLGNPVHISLHDTKCPYCPGKSGFHYASTHALHA